MANDVKDGDQLKILDFAEPRPGGPVRWAPTEDELQENITSATKMAIWKRHRGRPPRGMDWQDLYQEVAARTLLKVQRYMHGGKFNLFEYCYMAGCYALTDIQREEMRRGRSTIDDGTYPLFDDQ